MQRFNAATALAAVLFGVTAANNIVYSRSNIPAFSTPLAIGNTAFSSRICSEHAQKFQRRWSISSASARSATIRRGHGEIKMADNKFELEGIIKVIFDTMKFDSGFTKREFVVTTDEMYPQDIKFELLKEKCSLLDQYSVGDSVRVSFNIRGSLWQNRYFTNLQAWRMEKLGIGAGFSGFEAMPEWSMLQSAAAAAPRPAPAAPAAPPAWQNQAPPAPAAAPAQSWQRAAPAPAPTQPWQGSAPAGSAPSAASAQAWQSSAPAAAAAQPWQGSVPPASAATQPWQGGAQASGVGGTSQSASLSWDDDVPL